jgi:general stress protein 26
MMMFHRLGRAGAALLAILILRAAFLAAQPAPSPPPARDAIVTAARAIVEKARYATLISLDKTGHPHARIVDPFMPEPDWTIWIATTAASRKVGQIQADPRVTLLYFDTTTQSYVSLLGAAELVRDPAAKGTHWKEEWAAFYKDRNRGDDYVLIRVRPRRLEVVGETHGIRNDPLTWQPAAIDLQ